MADTKQSYTNIRANEYNNTNPFDSRIKKEGYNVGTLSYPVGLGVYPDLQHYVTFFINVRGKSQFVKNNAYEINSKVTPSKIAGGSIRNTLDNSDPMTALFFGGSVVAGSVAVAKGAATLLGVSGQDKKTTLPSKASQIGNVLGNIGKFAVGAAAGYALGEFLADTQTLVKDQTKRLRDVITLHMQEKPTVSYGINYQDKDLGLLGGFLGSETDASNTISPDRMAGLTQSAAITVAKIPSMLPGLGSITDIVQLGAKVKTNPFREVFFEGIDYRKFNFRYKFMPKDATEVSAVYNIISTFKEHMHPELAAGGAFFLYPSEFEIAYFFNNKENGYFNKIATCALTDMQVEYGGEQFSSFANGAPTEINLTLSFRELELITKETIRSKGY
jgi:hypothetical protein